MNIGIAIVAASLILGVAYVAGNQYKIFAVTQSDDTITVARLNVLTGKIDACTVKGWGPCLTPR